ncbi:uncharacterized protein METZ01_LOCUS195506, partial [marine metagenome]
MKGSGRMLVNFWVRGRCVGRFGRAWATGFW